MPSYAQLNTNSIAHTIMESPKELPLSARIVEISECDSKYLNCLSTGQGFVKLQAIPTKNTMLIGEIVNIDLSFSDPDGNPVDFTESLTVSIDGQTESVSPGTVPFESNIGGLHNLRFESASGLTTTCIMEVVTGA